MRISESEIIEKINRINVIVHSDKDVCSQYTDIMELLNPEKTIEIIYDGHFNNNFDLSDYEILSIESSSPYCQPQEQLDRYGNPWKVQF